MARAADSYQEEVLQKAGNLPAYSRRRAQESSQLLIQPPLFCHSQFPGRPKGTVMAWLRSLIASLNQHQPSGGKRLSDEVRPCWNPTSVPTLQSQSQPPSAGDRDEPHYVPGNLCPLQSSFQTLQQETATELWRGQELQHPPLGCDTHLGAATLTSHLNGQQPSASLSLALRSTRTACPRQHSASTAGRSRTSPELFKYLLLLPPFLTTPTPSFGV